jgi:AraC-like DNA-binding protein
MPGGELLLLQTLENLIEEHYKEHLPVTFYADQLHVTTKHLNEICKRALAKTTNELIQERSVLEAQRLLIHSELTSTQIAAELGYFDTTYFFRFFKKHTGQTPEQFRSEAK